MINKIFAIAKNTAIESLRQPIYAVIIISAIIMFFVSPSITMYTMSDDDKLLREIGLSTLFLSGLFIAVFTACSAITEEIDTKTVTTVLSKPVQRPVFIIGKFLGIALAVILAHFLLTIAHMLVLRHGVLSTASDTHDWTVLGLSIAAILATVIISAFMNYFYDWKFTSTAMIILTILSSIVIAVLCFIAPDWKFHPAENGFHLFDVYASILLLQAILVLVMLAVMFSTRFNIVLTLSFCVGIFLLGLINDYLFGKAAQTQIWAKTLRAIIPNFQVFWISDAIYEETMIPASYLLLGTAYSSCYLVAFLLIATALFQRKQVG